MRYVVICMICMLCVGCGQVEKVYENCNYESLTNEYGTVQFYSGGVMVKEYKTAKIVYSDSDNLSMWIKTNNGQMVYWQGHAQIIID